MTAGSIPAELATACADVAAAEAADAIADSQPRYVAAPASTDEAAALLRAAAALGLTVVPRGSGRRQHWGNPPVSCDLLVDTRRLDQVLEHAAGDQVLRVQAGVTLDELATKLATAGQRLALDPPGGGSAGGVLATNAAGPLRYRYGAPRDLLIGITFVRADGTVARSGGKVVKNVAGYDLGKLFAGSFGTLGLITEATFRLHPLPEQSAWLTLERRDPESAADAVQAVSRSPLAPSSIDLHWPSVTAPIQLIVGLDGDRPSVRARAERLRALVGPAVLPGDGAAREPESVPEIRQRNDRHPQHPDADIGTLIRVAFWVGQLAKVLTVIQATASTNRVEVAIEGSAGA